MSLYISNFFVSKTSKYNYSENITQIKQTVVKKIKRFLN